MNPLRSYRSWLALTAAIALWVFASYILWDVEFQKSNHALLVSNVEKEAQIVTDSSRLHGLMNDTKNERTALQGFISADVIAVADAIDAVGKTVGIEVHVDGVQPEAQKKGSQNTVTPVAFVIQTDGSFVQIARLVELLNALPIPTTIQQIDLAHSGAGWHLTAHLRVLTATENSS